MAISGSYLSVDSEPRRERPVNCALLVTEASGGSFGSGMCRVWDPDTGSSRWSSITPLYAGQLAVNLDTGDDFADLYIVINLPSADPNAVNFRWVPFRPAALITDPTTGKPWDPVAPY
jgi:hypothetical protein